MTTAPDPTPGVSDAPRGHERRFAGEPAEGRFAGALPAAHGRAAPPPPPPQVEPAAWSGATEAPDVMPGTPPPPLPAPPLGPPAPVVDYGPGWVTRPDVPAIRQVPYWTAPAIAALGAVLAVVGSLLRWATLTLAPSNPDDASFNDNTSSVTYNGLSLLEGRIMLLLGVSAAALGVLLLARRRRPGLVAAALLATGAVGLVVMLFAAAGHPVELATLFRSYVQINTVKVSLPNGAGIWLAMGGAALTLVAGLLAVLSARRESGTSDG